MCYYSENTMPVSSVERQHGLPARAGAQWQCTPQLLQRLPTSQQIPPSSLKAATPVGDFTNAVK